MQTTLPTATIARLIRPTWDQRWKEPSATAVNGTVNYMNCSSRCIGRCVWCAVGGHHAHKSTLFLSKVSTTRYGLTWQTIDRQTIAWLDLLGFIPCANTIAHLSRAKQLNESMALFIYCTVYSFVLDDNLIDFDLCYSILMVRYRRQMLLRLNVTYSAGQGFVNLLCWV